MDGGFFKLKGISEFPDMFQTSTHLKHNDAFEHTLGACLIALLLLALQFDNKSIYMAHFTCLTFISLIFARKC